MQVDPVRTVYRIHLCVYNIKIIFTILIHTIKQVHDTMKQSSNQRISAITEHVLKSIYSVTITSWNIRLFLLQTIYSCQKVREKWSHYQPIRGYLADLHVMLFIPVNWVLSSRSGPHCSISALSFLFVAFPKLIF